MEVLYPTNLQVTLHQVSQVAKLFRSLITHNEPGGPGELYQVQFTDEETETQTHQSDGPQVTQQLGCQVQNRITSP